MPYEFERDAVPVTEPTEIEAEFVSGLSFARLIDGMMFLAFHVEHVLPPEQCRRRERKIRSRLIIPPHAARRMIRMLEQALDAGGDHDSEAAIMVPSAGHHH
jgi:hypothetical protein